MGNDDKRLVDKQQRDDLRKLLLVATPGAWWTGTGEHWGRDVRPNVAFCGGPNGANDARLIAEMNKALPALLDALDAAEAEVDHLRAELARKAAGS